MVAGAPAGAGIGAGRRAGAAAGGYPDGSRTTPVPDLFFSRDLARLDDPVALKVLLYFVWRVHRRKAGLPPALHAAELAEDAVLADVIAAGGTAPDDVAVVLQAALTRLAADGLLLAHAGGRRAQAAGRRTEAQAAGRPTVAPAAWLFVNDHAGRETLRKVLAGELVLPLPAAAQSAASPGGPSHTAAARAAARGSSGRRAPAGQPPAAEPPNIYALYEDHIGLLTPMVAEELREAAERYPAAWVADAFREAALNNVRKWAYVRAILVRWASEGRTDEEHRRGTRTGRRRDGEGPYSDYIER